ncbi:UNVERIFIED_CONTAM: hypothetical protein FKN15_034555 [Acipenser sinensis]
MQQSIRALGKSDKVSRGKRGVLQVLSEEVDAFRERITGEANEMLLSGRKLTAQEACAKGLVSQVFWPGTFTQEVMVRIRELITCNSVVLRESKSLVRNAMKGTLEQANEKECEVLKRVWGSAQGMDSILKYLQKKIDEF